MKIFKEKDIQNKPKGHIIIYHKRKIDFDLENNIKKTNIEKDEHTKMNNLR